MCPLSRPVLCAPPRIRRRARGWTQRFPSGSVRPVRVPGHCAQEIRRCGAGTDGEHGLPTAVDKTEMYAVDRPAYYGRAARRAEIWTVVTGPDVKSREIYAALKEPVIGNAHILTPWTVIYSILLYYRANGMASHGGKRGALSGSPCSVNSSRRVLQSSSADGCMWGRPRGPWYRLLCGRSCGTPRP